MSLSDKKWKDILLLHHIFSWSLIGAPSTHNCWQAAEMSEDVSSLLMTQGFSVDCASTATEAHRSWHLASVLGFMFMP